MVRRSGSASRRWLVALCLFASCCNKHENAGKTGRPSAGKLCALLSPAELGSVAGLEGLQEPTVAVRSPVTTCTFSDPNRPVSLTVRFEAGRTPSDFAEIRQLHDKMGHTTTDLPGLGEAAASFSVGDYSGVTFLHAGTVIMVSGPVSIERLVAVARKLIERTG